MSISFKFSIHNHCNIISFIKNNASKLCTVFKHLNLYLNILIRKQNILQNLSKVNYETDVKQMLLNAVTVLK